MKDRRLPPFVWQSRAAMDVVRHCFSGKERTTAVAIYQAMTTLANDERSDNFTAPRRVIAELAGTSDRTIDRYVESFERVGLLEVERRTDGRPEASTYVLVEPDGELASPSRRTGFAIDSEAASHPVTRAVREEGEEETSAASAADVQLFETPDKPEARDPDEAKVGVIWTHHLEVFEGVWNPRVGLTPQRRTQLKKGLKAVEGDVELCLRASDGLKSYRQKHPSGSRDVSIEVIYKTRPGGSNLTDQIVWWADQAESTVPTPTGSVKFPIDLTGVPSVTKGRIQARRREVAQMFDHPESPDAQRRGEAAVDWLKEHIGHAPKIEDDKLRGWEYA